MPNRRAVLGGACLATLAGAAQAATGAVRALGKAAGRVAVTGVESFDIQMPTPRGSRFVPTYLGLTPGRNNVVKVTTSAGVTGYSFLGAALGEAEAARAMLTGANLFAVDAHVKRGLGPAVEEAVWDAIGKIAGQPLCRLMGGARIERVPVYFTYVWPVPEDQVPPREQGQQAARLAALGFKAMKIQIMRTDYHGDVEAVREMLAQGGPGFRAMVDRTAGARGLWSYDQSLEIARALQAAGCYWLEEPLARDDYDGPARLCREVDMLITGGEGWQGLGPFLKGLQAKTYDILQPEMRVCAGPLTMRKIGALCEAFGVPIAPHAATGLALAGRLQVSAAMGSVYQEVGTFQPDTLPSDVNAPFLPILHDEQPFAFENGEAVVPQYPGLGLNVDEKALEKFRVAGFERRGTKGITDR
ncbi:MAG TPA: mandelate racemase/muconate lactonizing enzyme family protein [Rhizomicrobium sp.]|nr:mandelate racemase/muconate lactonizing enzyme family protein [Rhizomicrobium sp.]